MLRKPEPILVSDLFPQVLEHLLSLLADLDAEDWRKPTVCEGWSVKDVALHLLGVEVGNLSVRRDDHLAANEVQGWAELVEFINAWNQDWVRVARRMSTRLLVEMLHFVGERVCDHFRLLDPDLIGAPVSWAGPSPAPVWLDLAREYTERWHHQQHIRDAVNQPGLKSPEYLAPVLATFVWGLPQAFRSLEAAEGTTITLTLVGESGGSWSVRREDDSWQLYLGSVEEPAATVRLHEDIAWRMFTRSVDWEAIEEQATISGDRNLAGYLANAVSIIA